MVIGKRILWFLFVFFCIAIGFYPLAYVLGDMSQGLLSTKSAELLANRLWNIGFYGHILFGGVSLLIGWSQFSSKLRRKRMNLHRLLGKVYVIAALISGVCGVCIASKATGGMVSVIGFGLLGLIWIFTTYMAYSAVRKKQIQNHQNLMIISYAACFAAVTLRLWLPPLILYFGEFEPAYRIVAWLCWVPNLIFAFWLIRRKENRLQTA